MQDLGQWQMCLEIVQSRVGRVLFFIYLGLVVFQLFSSLIGRVLFILTKGVFLLLSLFCPRIVCVLVFICLGLFVFWIICLRLVVFQFLSVQDWSSFSYFLLGLVVFQLFSSLIGCVFRINMSKNWSCFGYTIQGWCVFCCRNFFVQGLFVFWLLYVQDGSCFSFDLSRIGSVLLFICLGLVVLQSFICLRIGRVLVIPSKGGVCFVVVIVLSKDCLCFRLSV